MSLKFLHFQLYCAKPWILDDGNLFFGNFKQFTRFCLKDWSILGENMHVKSDCIFKAAFGLKYSLGKSLLI